MQEHGNLDLREFNIIEKMKNSNMGYLALDVDIYPKLIEKYPELTKEVSIYEKEKGGVL